MLPRISRWVLAIVVAFTAPEVGRTQHSPPPLVLPSIEWLVADSDVIVRGTIVEVTADENWNIVTLDVMEMLKGAKAERVKFAVHKFDEGDAALAQAKKSKREQLWLFKRQKSGGPSDAPDREKVLARHKIALHSPFPDGRPGAPALPVIPLGSAESKDELQPPAFLTIDLKLVKTSAEIVKAIRTAVAEPQGSEPVRSHFVALPAEIALRTGFGREKNLLKVPVDHRLEEFARRLVLSPRDFIPKYDSKNRAIAGSEHQAYLDRIYAIRLEGVKALRLFPSEKNLAVVRAWLDDPMSTEPLKGERKTIVPAMPTNQAEAKIALPAEAKIALPAELAQVPEIHFQQPLTKAMKTEDAQLHTAATIDAVHLLNQKKTDGFIETLMKARPDLGGLSFAMGDACRMKPDASKQFVAALAVSRKALSEDPKQGILMHRYKTLAAEQKVDPPASVASLMQVLGHEEAGARFDLAWYLDALTHADATRALAKLAIFSAETEVRSAALDALKKRDAKDYTEILLAGLKYPWPAVAQRSSEAIVKLGRKDLLPHLIAVLESPDPRAPQSRETDGKKATVVRELVRVNHHHSCLLCHAPAAKDEIGKLEGLTAQVPVPSESMVAYYRPSVPDILVRFDVTYLRQDFSMKLPVPNADPWPELQRYDFLVRTREMSEKEAVAYQKLLQPSPPEVMSPYRRAALSALRELTGLDAEPTAAAWRKLTGL